MTSVITPPVASSAPPEVEDKERPLTWLGERGMGASIFVAFIATIFGVLLVCATNFITAIVATSSLSDSATANTVFATMAVLFIGIAMYVAAIVTANTFSTIIAGRTRQIALMRLIGASARSERRVVARQGLVVGAIGAIAGWAVATIAAAVAGPIIASANNYPDDFSYSALSAAAIFPVVAVILTTWAAAWIGSRRVLTVTPLQALGGSGDRTGDDIAKKPRSRAAIVLLILGGGLLALGVVVGTFDPIGVLIAFLGGLLSFTGLAVGAVVVMPPILKLIGRLFGKSATARLAADNALRYPERSSRMAIAVVMGVALVTMFAVASGSVKNVLFGVGEDQIQDPEELIGLLDNVTAILMGLVGISAVIAAVGLVNLLTISIVQRTRELGLLRALGFTKKQIRNMVLLEAAHIAIASILTGLALGVLYGWAGAQSLLGSVALSSMVIVPPGIPWLLLACVVVGAAALTLIASVVPTRLATRVVPVEALSAD